jgi:hypothetical protein
VSGRDFRDWTKRAQARQTVVSPGHREFVDQVKGQLLIVLVKRLGGTIDLPIPEVDDTGRDSLALAVVDGVIRLKVRSKP